MVSSALFSLAFDSIISRISVKLTLDINNDIRSDIFEKILDADWLKLSGYNSGDILNRFNSDVGAVSSNAISWLPSVLIAVTALVPIVGAFVGCIVGALLIAVTSPVKALAFVVLFLVLQQVEGRRTMVMATTNSVPKIQASRHCPERKPEKVRLASRRMSSARSAFFSGSRA